MKKPVAIFTPYADSEGLLGWLEARWGFPADAFKDHRFWQRSGSGTVWVVAQECAPVPGHRLQALGMLAFRDPYPRGKPTSVFLQRFGAAATRNVYRLNTVDARQFLCAEPVAVTPIDDPRGYCIVGDAQRIYGCGWLEAGELNSVLPRSWLEGLAIS